MLPRPVVYMPSIDRGGVISKKADVLIQRLYEYLYESLANDSPNVKLTNYAIIRAVACFIKNNEFRAEDESRLLVFPINDCTSTICKPTPIHFKLSDRNVLRPYVEVYCGKKLDYNCSKQLTGLPIKSITVGPGGNQDAVFQSIIFRIDNGIDEETNIAESNGNVREWEYYSQFLKKLSQDNGINYNISVQELKQLKKMFKSDFSGFVNTVKQLGCFRQYQGECYFSERRKIIIRKSKIPYIY